MNQPLLSASVNTISLDQIKARMGSPPWWKPVVLAEHIVGTVICEPPDQVNDLHCHDFDEWWLVLEGRIDWVIEGAGNGPVKATSGDFIFIPALTFHQIFPTGGGPSIRLALSLPGHGHLAEKPANKARIRID